MKRKILTLIIFLILLTGCTSNVNITITPTVIKEDFTILEEKNIIYDGQTIDKDWNLRKRNFEWEHDGYYSIKDISENNMIGREYSFETDYDKWKDLSLLRKCYNGITIEKKQKRVYINTSEVNQCIKLYGNSEINVNIITNNRVTNNNADKIENDVYTWIINDNNYQNKPISIAIDFSKASESSVQKNEKTASKISIIIFSIIGLFAVISVIYIYIKVKKSNK